MFLLAFALRKVQHESDVPAMGLRFGALGLFARTARRICFGPKVLCDANFWTFANSMGRNQLVHFRRPDESSGYCMEHLQVREGIQLFALSSRSSSLQVIPRQDWTHEIAVWCRKAALSFDWPPHLFNTLGVVFAERYPEGLAESLFHDHRNDFLELQRETHLQCLSEVLHEL